MNTFPRTRACFWILATLLLALAACADDTADPEGNNAPVDACDQEGAKLAVSLEEPVPLRGFAPLSVSFQGQISLIEDVDFTWTYDFGDGTNASGVNSQPNSVHEFTAPGNYTVRLQVKDDTCGTQAIAQANVEVFAPVELSGSDLTGRPGNITVLDTLQIAMDVSNEADVPLTLPVTVSFYLSPRPGVLWDEVPTLVPLTNVTLNPSGSGETIGAGASRNINETVEISHELLTGSYHIIAAIDLTDDIGEGDEERNNLVSSNAPVFIDNVLIGGADLLAEKVQVGPSTAFQRVSAISINADIKNIGSRTADTNFAVYTTLDPAAPVEDADLVFTSTELIPMDFRSPNNIFSIRAQQVVLPEPIELPEGVDEMEVYIWVCVDPDGVVTDANVDNNCALSEGSVLVSNTPQEGTDIVLVDFQLNPSSTFLDGTVEVILEVSNFGTNPTRSFFCGIYLSTDENFETSDERLTNVNFSNLEEGETQQVNRISTVPGFLPVGSFTVFAFCDPSNVVRETFEDNNIRRLPNPLIITAEAIIDLTINTVTVNPPTLQDGADLTLNLNVGNTGTSGAGPSVINVRRSLDQSCTGTDPLIGTIQVPSLSPQTDADVELIVDGLRCDIFQPSYFLCLQIDPGNNVPEVNETNNLTLVQDPLLIEGPRCQCQPDAFEPNETPQTAVPLTDGDFVGQTICQSRGKDFYGIDLSVGQSLSVRVNLAHTGTCANLDLQILDPNFQPIPDATSQTDGQLEQANLFLVQRQGRYIIRVQGRTDCDVNSYDLEVSIASPGPGVDLTGRDLLLNDTNPALGQSVSATFRTLNVADDPAGPYKVRFFLTQDLTIDVTDFELATLDATAGLLGARARDDQLTFTIPVGAINGAYFVCAVLDADSDITENNEENNTLCSAQITVDTACYDPFEVNDTPAQATNVQPGQFENLNVCDQGRADHYRFCVADGSRVEARVDFVHRSGDIDMRLLSDAPGFPEVANSTGVRDFESIVLDFVTGDQCYIVAVFLNDRVLTSNNYQMNIRVDAADPLLRCDSIFEPNNTPDAAISSGSDLVEAINEGLVLDRCPANDFDFYYVDLVAGPTITLCASNDVSNPITSNLNVALFDPGQRQLVANTGPNPCVTHLLTVSGRYFVRVLSVNPDQRAVRYTMSLAGLFGIDLVGRNLSVDPTDITPGDTLVVYEFTMENARTDRAEDITYGIYYSLDPVIDPVEDFLIDLRQIGALNGFSEIDILDTFIMPSEGPYVAGQGYVGIFIDPDDSIDEENDNNNRLLAQINTLICAEDAFAGNHTQATGAFIDLNTNVPSLNICPGVNDWYCLDGLNPGSYTAQAAFTLNPADRIGSDLNLEVRLVDDQLQDLGSLGRDTAIANNATVTFTLDAPGGVCLLVSPLRSTSTNTYSLLVSQND